MGAIAGSLGAIDFEAGVETRLIIDRLEQAIRSLQNAGVGQPGPRYALSFIASTTWTIPGARHGFNTRDLHVMTYDATGKKVDPDSVTVDPSTFAVTITWATAQAGRAVIV
jgi:hypothetical protein